MTSVNLPMPPLELQEVELNNVVKGQMGSKTRGVSLTWNDLWVTVSTRKSGNKSILQGLTGYARPSELLAVMGPSGCGKSTLLDALADGHLSGRLDFSTRQSGEILINGHKQKLSYGTFSVCMEILTRPKLLFLDEPTSGLDSAASYYVMSGISRQREGRTIIASIHQPSAEVFNLFHNLCLLSSGRTVYFGPDSRNNQNQIGEP